MKKKVLSLILCIAMLFSLVPAIIPVSAEDVCQLYGEDLEANPGDTVTMKIFLRNPVEIGLCGISTSYKYDSVLTLKGVTNTFDRPDIEFMHALQSMWLSDDPIIGDMELGYATIQIAEDAAPGVYDFSFTYVMVTDYDFGEPECIGATQHITVKGEEPEPSECEHEFSEGAGVVTEPTRTEAGKVEFYCDICEELVPEKTITLPAVEIGFSMDNVTVHAGDDITLTLNAKLPATGLWGAPVYIYWDEALGLDADAAIGSTWATEEFYLDSVRAWDKTAADKAAACGVDFDGTGKNIAATLVNVDDATTNLYGEGELVTVTIHVPENVEPGTYNVGALVHDALIGGYLPEWYAGVVNAIEYDVTGAERLVSATVTVTDHKFSATATEGSGKVTPPTRTEAGKVELYCDDCGELVKTIELPAVDIAFTMDDITAAPGEEITLVLNAKLPATGLFAAPVYMFWDEALGLDATAAIGSTWAGEEWTLDSIRPYDDHAAGKVANSGVTFDGTGKNIAATLVNVADATTNLYGEGELVTVTIKAPTQTGTYEIGAIVHEDLFGGYIKDWYAGIANVIDYDVTGEERLVTATLTVECAHESTHEENRVEATCTENGHYDLVCDVCGEVVEANVQIEAKGHGTTHEDNRVDPKCEEDGHYDLVCDVCGEVVSTVTLPQTGHKMGAWYQTKAPEIGVAGEERRDCENGCGYFETRELPALVEKVLDLDIEKGYYAAEATINNETRVINVTAKPNATEVDFRVIFPDDQMRITRGDDAENITLRQLRDGVVETVGTESQTQWKYFVAEAKYGLEQTYTVVVTAEGVEYVYTVYVTFDLGPACTGVEPGWAANASLTGFVEGQNNVINVVSKPGMTEVDFRLLGMAVGSYANLTEGNAHVVQWVVADNAYVDVTLESTKETQTQWKYFRSYKSEGTTQDYTITVTMLGGVTVDYTVHVEFVD